MFHVFVISHVPIGIGREAHKGTSFSVFNKRKSMKKLKTHSDNLCGCCFFSQIAIPQCTSLSGLLRLMLPFPAMPR